jgi:hypothetical protein
MGLTPAELSPRPRSPSFLRLRYARLVRRRSAPCVHTTTRTALFAFVHMCALPCVCMDVSLASVHRCPISLPKCARAHCRYPNRNSMPFVECRAA